MFNKYIKKTTCILAVLIIGIGQSNASNTNYWTDISVNSVNRTNTGSKVYPEKFRALSLNYEALKSELLKAPTSTVQNFSKMKAVVISVPMPYGNVENFKVVETPMMEAELANKYSAIKTFTGVSLENPANTAKFDIGPYGFHGMVLSDEGRYFIDPVSNFTTTEYMSYYRRDLPTWANSFNCGTVSDEEFMQETKTRLEAYYARGGSAEVQLRTYRLALACTVEYSAAATGLANPTKQQVLAKMVTSMNRVNGVYEKDVAVHMDLVAKNDTLIYLPGTTDPYTNNDGATMLTQNVTTINARIGLANYDIGHVFSTGGGGIAGLGVVCTTGKARGVTGSPSPVGDAFDIDYVAHEMGHQFAGNHTFNSVTGSCGGGNRNANTAWEPGSGTTVMAYAGICGADDIASNSDPYFHSGSLDEINAFITAGSGNSCPVKTLSGNNPPVVNAGANYTIPISTPFMLTGSATDPENDVLSYSWEQMDIGPSGAPNSATGNAPLFRFYPPRTTPVRMFPKLNDILTNVPVKGERLPNYARTMKFRLTARDNKPAGATGKADMTITVSAAAGPFSISNFNTVDTMLVGTQELITWNVANTNATPINCSLVRISLSTDAGQTFPIILADSTANDGSETITVPNNLTTTGRIKVEAIGNIFFDINNAVVRVVAPSSPSFNITAVSNTPNGLCPPDSASFDVNFSSILGFNNTITVSTSNVPVGSNVTLSKTSVLPGETVNVKVSTLGLTAGNKTLTVTGTSGNIVKSTTLAFSIVSAISTTTAFTSPANGQVNVSPNSPFTWTSISTASAYKMQIARDSNFTDLVLDTLIVGAGSTSYTPSGLPQGTVLYAKIAGANACGVAAFSKFISFTTASVPNAPSNLIQLGSSSNSVTIKWTDNSTNETGFRVERSIGNDSTFLEVANNLGANTTIYISGNLTPGTTYYYRVRSVNGVGFSDYSNVLVVPFAVGINAYQSFDEFNIFPNPSSDVFNIQIADAYRGNTTLSVTDEMGRIILSEKVTKNSDVLNSKFDLSTMPNGVYFLKVNTDDRMVTKRIVKLK